MKNLAVLVFSLCAATGASAATVTFDGERQWAFGEDSRWGFEATTVTATGHDLAAWDGTGDVYFAEFVYYNAVNAGTGRIERNTARVDFSEAELANFAALGLTGLDDFTIAAAIDRNFNEPCTDLPLGCPDEITYSLGSAYDFLVDGTLNQFVHEEAHHTLRLGIRASDIPSAVPLPFGGLLLGSALVLLGLRRRRDGSAA